jgi:hypothetical protein
VNAIVSTGGSWTYLTTFLARVSRAADWHATMALKAYRKRDYPTYTRHIRIADKLRAAAG